MTTPPLSVLDRQVDTLIAFARSQGTFAPVAAVYAGMVAMYPDADPRTIAERVTAGFLTR